MIGQRAPGAITFEPVLGGGADSISTDVILGEIARAADKLRAEPVAVTQTQVDQALARGGSSLGGAL